MDSRQIERKAQAAQQSMAKRAQRLEKAQAAAVQAQLAARHMQRQSSQQKDQQQQPGRATLQQVSPCPASCCCSLLGKLLAFSPNGLPRRLLSRHALHHAMIILHHHHHHVSCAGLQQCTLEHLLIDMTPLQLPCTMRKISGVHLTACAHW